MSGPVRPAIRRSAAIVAAVAPLIPIVLGLLALVLGVIIQAEIETFAIEPDGTVAWRVAHSDVVTAAELIGGRLILTGFDGQLNAVDPVTGRSAA